MRKLILAAVAAVTMMTSAMAAGDPTEISIELPTHLTSTAERLYVAFHEDDATTAFTTYSVSQGNYDFDGSGEGFVSRVVEGQFLDRRTYADGWTWAEGEREELVMLIDNHFAAPVVEEPTEPATDQQAMIDAIIAQHNADNEATRARLNAAANAAPVPAEVFEYRVDRPGVDAYFQTHDDSANWPVDPILGAVPEFGDESYEHGIRYGFYEDTPENIVAYSLAAAARGNQDSQTVAPEPTGFNLQKLRDEGFDLSYNFGGTQDELDRMNEIERAFKDNGHRKDSEFMRSVRLQHNCAVADDNRKQTIRRNARRNFTNHYALRGEELAAVLHACQ